jgi:hypothetical protein
MILIHEPIPKKLCRDAKHCTLCKKHGGMHVMHNTLDCCKYEKDGKLKKHFGKGKRGSTASDKITASTFAQLLVKIAKLKKANEKLKKSSRKRKRNYDSDSDDPDSSLRGGSGSTWGRNCRKPKVTSNSQLDKILPLVQVKLPIPQF